MNVEKYMDLEWKIMRSIGKHGAAFSSQILADLKDEPYTRCEIIEGIARLMETRIIYFSVSFDDFLFSASSKLTKDVGRFSTPTISLDEYRRYAWTRLAELGA